MSLRLQKPKNDPSSAWPAIGAGVVAAFGGVLYGYDTGTISGLQAMPYWQTQFDHPSSGRISLIVSILSVGTFCGALLASPLADTVGRRWGLILSAAIPFNLGVILQTAATTQSVFIAGRAFAGVGVGLVSVQIPMYQAESLPKWCRGFVTGCYQFCITIGLLVASCVTYATRNRNDSGSYRIPLAIQFAWSIILCTGMFLLPESPRFWIKKGQHEKAIKSLVRLRRLPADHPYIVDEAAEITASYEYEQSLGTVSYPTCFRGNLGKRLFTGVGLQCLQQLVGVNFIFYYGTSYFTSQKNNLPNGFILSVITNIVNVVSTIPGLYAIDTLGRRTVLLTGAAGMFVTQYIVAITGVATHSGNNSAQAAEFAFICIYISFFAATWGPGAWVVTGEIFPLQARAKCLSMTTASNWLFNWLLSFIIPYLEGAQYANLGSKVFFIWGSISLLAVFFVWGFIYETKGLSLEHVNLLYNEVPHAWQSGKHPVQDRRFSITPGDEKGYDGNGAPVATFEDTHNEKA